MSQQTRSDRVYRVVRRLLFTVDPERIHRWVAFAIALLRFPIPNHVARRLFSVREPELRSTVFGVDFPAPVGLAAGFDKNGAMVDSWGAMGFGFAEIGTVTGQGQPGNPTPRLFRLPADRALVNRMGFNNPGAGAVAVRLRERRPELGGVPIGINIGKTKLVESAAAVDDYRYSARMLGGLADFVVVNVSSPNTPGLRDLQAVASLRPLLAAVLDEVQVPVLVKIAPDLADHDIDEVADLALELGLAGMVCTNTTIGRDGLRTDPAQVAGIGAGGLSGAPLAERSLAVLRRVYRRTEGQLPIISVGGIETADQAWERIRAGASLVQGYTGFIYGGPGWAKALHTELARLVRAGGYRTIADVVGTGSAE